MTPKLSRKKKKHLSLLSPKIFLSSIGFRTSGLFQAECFTLKLLIVLVSCLWAKLLSISYTLSNTSPNYRYLQLRLLNLKPDMGNPCSVLLSVNRLDQTHWYQSSQTSAFSLECASNWIIWYLSSNEDAWGRLDGQNMFPAALIRVAARDDGFKHYLWSWQTKVQGNENITGLCGENCIFAQPSTAGISPSEVTLGSTELKGNCNLDAVMQIWLRNVREARKRQKPPAVKAIFRKRSQFS